MDLFEYQAKELFAEYGVPVQAGQIARTAEEARAAAAEFAAQGHPLVVVKAQVKTGGRGKAGGVKLANGPDEAYDKASQILGMDIKGHTVHSVLMAQAVDIAAEYYLSFLMDRADGQERAVGPVQQEGQVVLGGDVDRLGDEHRVHGVALDVHAQDLTGLVVGLVRAVGQLDAAGLTTAARLDLGLDHDQRMALGGELGRGLARLFRRAGDLSGLHGDAVLGEQLLRLILKQVHA